MAGIHADRGDKSHRLVSGERPEVGMRVFTNDWTWGTIVELDEANMGKDNCGWYCEAWARVDYEDGSRSRVMLNCERMTTRKPS
jgi:hypothetical protein